MNASVVISQGLLTGWTREALCKSLSTGTFETKGKGTVSCSHYQRRFITQFGVFFLKVLILAAYGAFFLTLILLMMVFTGYIISVFGYTACKMGDEYIAGEFDLSCT